MNRILFVGGPGNISTSAIRKVLDRNWKVGIFTLPASPAEGLETRVEFFRGNRDSLADYKAAFDAFKPDVVLDVCCFKPDQARTALEAVSGRLSQYILFSTVDIYGYPLSRIPMRETDPLVPPISPYASDKRECETIFRAAHDAGKVPLTVVRPSYSFGPAFVLNLFSRAGGRLLVPRIRAGLPVLVPGDGTTLIHPGSARNTGLMAAELVGSDRAIGKSYNLAHEHAITQDDYYRLFGRAVGVEPKLVHVPSELLLPHEMKLIPDNLLSELTRFNICFSVDAFLRDFPVFKYEWSLDEAARDYVRFHDAAGDWLPAGPSYEDRIAAAWAKCAAGFVL